MDDKVSRRKKSETPKRRYLPMGDQVRAFGRAFRRVVETRRGLLATCLLLCLLIWLLFALARQLPGPVSDTTPQGVTSLDYTAFMRQIAMGNVEAVMIRGDEINGLLALPVTTQLAAVQHLRLPTQQQLERSPDYAAWQQTLGVADGSSWPSESTSAPLSSSRAIYTHIPTGANGSLITALTDHHVLIKTLASAQDPIWLPVLLRFLPVLLMAIVLLAFFFIRKDPYSARSMDERISQMGRNRARRFDRVKEQAGPRAPQKPTMPFPQKHASLAGQRPVAQPRVSTIPSTTFADVAGIDEVRAELAEIVQFLQQPERFTRLGARIPRGALLAGPPGTGKTLLAKAVAGEAGVPFFSMSASEFVEMFVGVGASRVRELFQQARQVAPCVIFLDEIDAIGRKRSMRVSSSDERDQTLNQLLVELDGFDERQAVVVLAATNRVDILDSALLRPGRFDRRITVSPPDRAGREAILQVHTRQTPLHADVSLERLARMTTGMTGADLANLVNEAALSAARQDLDCVTHACFEHALARVQLGALRPLVMSEQERRIIAVHESGHALVAHHLPEADTVNRVTILPRGQSLGVTQFTAEVDRYNYSRETLMARIAVGLGGRVAEELTFGAERVTTGAENDLQVVTDLARRMVTRWGMSEHVGLVFADAPAAEGAALNLRAIDLAAPSTQARSLVADDQGQVYLNGAWPVSSHAFALAPSGARSNNGIMLNALIDAEVQRILNEGRAIARRLLTKHAAQLTLLTATLIEHEQLDRVQFEALLKD